MNSANELLARRTAGQANILQFPPGRDFEPEIQWIYGELRKLRALVGSGSGSGGIIPPLYLQKVDPANVFVTFGKVNGLTPTGVATNINVSGTNGTWSVYLNCTLSADGGVTAAAVNSAAAGVPADTSGSAYALIGEVDVSAGVITAVRPSLMFSQAFVACGRDSSNPTTTPGTYAFYVGSSGAPSGGGGGPPPLP